MSSTDLSDDQLLDMAKSALRQNDINRAGPLFAKFAERRVACVRAKVANDAG